MTQLLSDLLNSAEAAKGRPVRDEIDPNYRITTADNGWLLKWRGVGLAKWILAADALPNTDVLTYRAGTGILMFEAELPGDMSCGFPGHNAVGMPLGYVQLMVDTNPDNVQAQWVLAGATGLEIAP